MFYKNNHSFVSDIKFIQKMQKIKKKIIVFSICSSSLVLFIIVLFILHISVWTPLVLITYFSSTFSLSSIFISREIIDLTQKRIMNELKNNELCIRNDNLIDMVIQKDYITINFNMDAKNIIPIYKEGNYVLINYYDKESTKRLCIIREYKSFDEEKIIEEVNSKEDYDILMNDFNNNQDITNNINNEKKLLLTYNSN